jgi:hypothetical protein
MVSVFLNRYSLRQDIHRPYTGRPGQAGRELWPRPSRPAGLLGSLHGHDHDLSGGFEFWGGAFLG